MSCCCHDGYGPQSGDGGRSGYTVESLVQAEQDKRYAETSLFHRAMLRVLPELGEAIEAIKAEDRAKWPKGPATLGGMLKQLYGDLKFPADIEGGGGTGAPA